MNIEDEKQILDEIVDLHNHYLSLEGHNSDTSDWVDAIHQLQRIIATRIVRKEHPEIFK